MLFLPHQTNGQQQSFEEYKKQQQQAFEQYISEQDAAFADFLRTNWSEKAMDRALGLLENKPSQLPTLPSPSTPANKPEPDPASPVPDPTTSDITPDITPNEALSSSPIPPLPPLENPDRTVTVELLGLEVSVPVLERFDPAPLDKLSNDTIADYWLTLAATEYPPLVNRLAEVIRIYQWNDWAASMLVRKVAEAQMRTYQPEQHRAGTQSYAPEGYATQGNATQNYVPQGEENATVALTWFLLSKLGYAAHAGYYDTTLVLMMPSDTRVYSVPSLTLEGSEQPYYIMSSLNRDPERVRSVYTYEREEKQDGGEDGDILHLYVRNRQANAVQPQQRDLVFEYEGVQFDLRLEFDLEIVDFLRTFPKTDLNVFFEFPPSAESAGSYVRALAPLLLDRSLLDQLNLLLRFVQTAFEYKTDRDQFGEERFMTPDEILYYPYSDCDDKAILFAYLVRELLGLDVVGLEYSQHVATGVRMVEGLPEDGDVVEHNGERYLVSDPTYVNAGAGVSMPKYAVEEPKVIELGVLR